MHVSKKIRGVFASNYQVYPVSTVRMKEVKRETMGVETWSLLRDTQSWLLGIHGVLARMLHQPS